MATPAPFPQSPVLTTIAIGYRNPTSIADAVLPRVTVGSESFKYSVYSQGDAFTVPNTRVGRRGRPTTVEFGGTEVSASTDDYALDASIPNADIQLYEAQRQMGVSSYDPQALAVMRLTDTIQLDREVRVANLVFNAATYDATRQATLSGTSQFSDYANSNPITTIMAALDKTLVFRPNTAVMGRDAWTAVRQHPKLVNAVKGGSLQSGVISESEFASIFDLKEVLIGDSFVNLARPGQTLSLARAWGKHLALIYKNPLAFGSVNDGQLSFGLTAQWRTRISGNIPDPNIGMRGGVGVRVGESVKELIVAPQLGYFLQNVAA